MRKTFRSDTLVRQFLIDKYMSPHKLTDTISKEGFHSYTINTGTIYYYNH